MSLPSRAIWFALCLTAAAAPMTGQEVESMKSKVTLLEERRLLLPRISPDGKRLAYLTYASDGEMPNVYVREFDTDHSGRLLAKDVLEETDLAWNRAGDRLALLRQVDDRIALEILQMNADSRLSATLPGVSIQGGLGWLSDDRHIAVGCEQSLLIIDAESGEVIRQVQISDESLSPDMSRISVSDQDRIAFAGTSDGDTNQKIWLATIDSTSAVPVSVTEGPTDSSPQWIDDSTIVFSRTEESAASGGFDVSHLWRIDVHSRRDGRISVGNVQDTCPSWSPAERLLVFSRLLLSSVDLSEREAGASDTKAPTVSAILRGLAGVARDVYYNIRVAYMRLDE